MSKMAASDAPGESPHTVVHYPRTGLSARDVGEVYAYRNLLYLFFWRDIKTRYMQSYLGGVWIVLSPLVSTAIYSVLLVISPAFLLTGYPIRFMCWSAR